MVAKFLAGKPWLTQELRDKAKEQIGLELTRAFAAALSNFQYYIENAPVSITDTKVLIMPAHNINFGGELGRIVPRSFMGWKRNGFKATASTNLITSTKGGDEPSAEVLEHDGYKKLTSVFEQAGYALKDIKVTKEYVAVGPKMKYIGGQTALPVGPVKQALYGLELSVAKLDRA